MINKILKVFFPLVVLLAIALVVMRTKKSIDSMGPSEIEPFEFSTYVDDIIQSELKGKPYNQAKMEYWRIYGIIKTEEGLLATDLAGMHQPVLSDTVAQDCYQRAFQAYWPAFESMAEGIFTSNWTGEQLGVIKAEATALRQHKGTSLRNDSLTHYLAYIDDYNAASRFVSKITCDSKSKYDTIVAKKVRFKKKYPLCNNRSLVEKLDEVPETAKNKWKNSIVSSVDEACKKTDLTDFLTAKSGCDTNISDFNRKFPHDKLSEDVTTDKLKNKWYVLLTNAVVNACLIDNLGEFSSVYSDLRGKIDAYGSDPDDLKGRLRNRYNELRGY